MKCKRYQIVIILEITSLRNKSAHGGGGIRCFEGVEFCILKLSCNGTFLIQKFILKTSLVSYFEHIFYQAI
jgi:hypothetical protein